MYIILFRFIVVVSVGVLAYIPQWSIAQPVAPCRSVQSSDEGPALPQANLVDEKCVTFNPPKDDRNPDGDLVEIGFWMKQYRRMVQKTQTSEPEAGTVFYAWYETKSLATLEKYAFVQFMRGCAYSVMYMNGKSEIVFWEKDGGTKGNSIYYAEDWEIDGSSMDPVYTSGVDEGFSRFHYAQWTDRPREFPTKFAKEYGIEKPIYPILGMVDTPSPASVRKWGNGRILALNTALELRTCLYRIEDIPAEVGKRDNISAPPIKCVDWQNVNIYDPVNDTIKSPQNIPQICRENKEVSFSKEDRQQ